MFWTLCWLFMILVILIVLVRFDNGFDIVLVVRGSGYFVAFIS